MSARTRLVSAFLFVAFLVALLAIAPIGLAVEPAEPPAKKRAAEKGAAEKGAADKGAVDGREIFLREWIPDDPRSHGGDGLGPAFNDTSCVACHNQGGIGGGGPAGKNVDLVTAFSADVPQQHPASLGTAIGGPVGAIVQLFFEGQALPQAVPGGKAGKKRNVDQAEKVKRQRKALAKIHPGLETARSVVLHRFATDQKFAKWRSRMNGTGQFAGGIPGMAVGGGIAEMDRLAAEVQFGGRSLLMGPAQVDGFFFVKSQRNATALFGAGRLDRVPDKVLKGAAAKKYKEFPQISGRVARLKGDKLGRFGWKAQEPSLHDFVQTACAVELGLHVPGRAQGALPQQPGYEPPGLDLSQQELTALVSYVAELPAPVERQPVHEKEAAYLTAGRRAFTEVGCATCHTPDLGQVSGVYSDLLLHDMGPQLADSGSYGGASPNRTEEEELQEPLPSFVAQVGPRERKLTPAEEAKLVGALRHEWRTPPLWGLRDSAPYLHDGRAATLEQAIAMHGGEAALVARKYFRLKGEQRQQVTAFLKSLAAPH